MIPDVQVKVLHDGILTLEKGSPLASGFDLRAHLPSAEYGCKRTYVLKAGCRMLVGTGLAFAIPEGFEGQVRPRSGLAARHGITVLNAPGTIDPDYRGEVKIVLMNAGAEPFVVHNGDRVAQLVIAPVCRPRMVMVEELTQTQRGSAGFGSTGVK